MNTHSRGTSPLSLSSEKRISHLNLLYVYYPFLIYTVLYLSLLYFSPFFSSPTATRYHIVVFHQSYQTSEGNGIVTSVQYRYRNCVAKKDKIEATVQYVLPLRGNSYAGTRFAQTEIPSSSSI